MGKGNYRTHISAAPAWMDEATLQAVRPRVRALLESSQGFQALPDDKKRELARTMVRVASYMSNPDGLTKEELGPNGGVLVQPQAASPPTARAAARGLAEDPTEAARRKASDKVGSPIGKDFVAGAARQYTEEFGNLVGKVDFPKFVGGLIQNVFEAIVDSSIKQMEAYGQLLANVAKTVDQFAQDNITMNNSRDWLAGKYPDQLSIQIEDMGGSFAEGEQPVTTARVAVREGLEDPEAFFRQLSQEFQLAQPITDISDPAEEARLVQAARLQIARSRQQLLSSMVMLGINRIVVTDGLINAKVIFDMRASDIARRRVTASMHDSRRDTAYTNTSASYSSWFSPVSASFAAGTTSEHVATVGSAVDETSESKGELKAKLSGEVRVNFKSDYFPMEKLANPQMIAAIQGNARPVETPAANAPASAPAPVR